MFPPYQEENLHIKTLIDSVSQADRQWIVEKIVRLAPEFGVCTDLGAKIVHYFVDRETDPESEHNWQLHLVLEKEISSSRLKFVFENSIKSARMRTARVFYWNY